MLQIDLPNDQYLMFLLSGIINKKSNIILTKDKSNLEMILTYLRLDYFLVGSLQFNVVEQCWRQGKRSTPCTYRPITVNM